MTSNNPIIFTDVNEFQKFRLNLDGSIGFVPTMGALHDGHESLLKRSRDENKHTFLSIFVNPTQFNNLEDLEKYPKTFDADFEIAKNCKVSGILYPKYEQIYFDNYRFKMTENEFSKILCGAHRPGHFDGVLTVVMKLLQIVKADKAYFGEKDFQQLQLIKDMVSSFFIQTQIISCPTLREVDGLAMSSRNRRLTTAGRLLAPLIYKNLSSSKSIDEIKSELEKNEIKVEYLEEHFNRRFIAAFIDNVRLIDNVAIK